MLVGIKPFGVSVCTHLVGCPTNFGAIEKIYYLTEYGNSRFICTFAHDIVCLFHYKGTMFRGVCKDSPFLVIKPSGGKFYRTYHFCCCMLIGKNFYFYSRAISANII